MKLRINQNKLYLITGIFLAALFLLAFSFFYFEGKKANRIEYESGNSAASVSYTPKTEKEKNILAELSKIKDPEFNGPLDKFILINSIKEENGNAEITIGLPEYCPYKNQITGLIDENVGKLAGINSVKVTLGAKDTAVSPDESSGKIFSSPVKNILKGIKISRFKLAGLKNKFSNDLQKYSQPKINDAWVSPEKIMVGEKMTVEITINDNFGIKRVEANMGDVETISLKLKEGTRRSGVWQAVWTAHDTELKEYLTKIKVENFLGQENYAELKWFDPPSWWNSNYAHRRQITVTNNTGSTLNSGYATWATVDTATLIDDTKMLSSGDDLRILYWNGTTNVELDRHIRYLDTSTSEIYFKTQANISGSGTDNNYFIYYGYAGAGSPPANGSNIYEYWTDFSDLTGWSTLYGTATASGGAANLQSGSEIYRDAGYLGNTYNKVFEQRVKIDVASARASWWGIQMAPPSTSWYCGNQCCDGSYDGYRDLALFSSVENDVDQTNLRGLTGDANGDEDRTSTSAPGTDYNVYSEKWNQAGVTYMVNRSQQGTSSRDVNTSSYNVFFQIWNYSDSGDDLQVDWYLSRPYVSPEPSSALDTEEDLPADVPTEFVAVVDPGSGTGTDYTSLYDWEYGVGTDLTASATRVFSGTRTSTMADDATVYLCRGETYQTHYGTLVHATNGQILIESISGTAVEESGDIWYTNSTCNSSNYFTISDGGNSAIAVAKCRTSDGSADTDASSIIRLDN